MFREWLKAMMIFFQRGYQSIIRDVNNQKFSTLSVCLYHLFFIGISLVTIVFLPKGISNDFIDYIKDIFAIFIGFFITALTLIYDKLNITKIPTQEENNKMPVEERLSSDEILRIKQEHYYVIRFFYSIGFNILYATTTLLLITPIIFWEDFFSMDVSEYSFVHHFADINRTTIFLGVQISLLFVYRLIIILFIVKVFFFTIYMITSLLQVLISKKKI